MEELRVADAITEIFNLFKRCNKYIDETMPWQLAKDPEQKDRLSDVLYYLIDSISLGASILEPFMPQTAERISKQLGVPLWSFQTQAPEKSRAESFTVTSTPEILFARLDQVEIQEKVRLLE
jgi:methionyl-tRNA synthetase